MNGTKYVVVLCDGMADYPLKELGDKTPMEAAVKPNMNYLASNGVYGLVKTVPDGMKPGSDVANLSVMGYDPRKCYTGRSPLEAVSMGIKLGDNDVALRCNLVTLSDEENYADKTMVDYCAGDISTQEAAQLIKAVGEALGNEEYIFYPGFSYRHCLVWKNGTVDVGFLTPPHDISGRVIGEYLNSDPRAEKLIEMMKKSEAVLKNHPVNIERIKNGKRPATSIWLWGQGSRPALDSFESEYGKKGAVVSAVDLIKGIGMCADMTVCEVEGATGYVDTNFEGKTEAALEQLKNGCDFVYLHFEAPDECGHRHEMENKVKSIELIDSIVLDKLMKELKNFDRYKIMVLPDHPTPISTMTHEMDPVPFIIYDSAKDTGDGAQINICERTAKQSDVYKSFGFELMPVFLSDD